MARKKTSPNDFRIRLSKSLEQATGSRHDELRVLAVALWFEMVRKTLRLRSAYALERHFAPDAFRRNAFGDRNHNNNWSKYAVGARCPMPELVARVEQAVPGSANLLSHPLWHILRSPDIGARRRKKHFRSLPLDVQRIVLGNKPSGRSYAHQSPLIIVAKRQLSMLERRAGIDALAALVALMYDARELGRQDVALHIGDYVYNVLLITCMFPPFRRVARELFDCFQRRVFDGIEHGGERIYLPTMDCELAIELLSLATRQVRNARDFGYRRHDYVRVCVDLLGTKYGFGVRCALASPHVLAGENGEADVGCNEKIMRQERNRIWGLATLFGLRTEKHPPLGAGTGEPWEPDEALVEALSQALSLFGCTFP